MKKAEREEIWDRVNAQAEEVFRDDESMRDFLNFMAQCTPQSTRNLLLLYEQDPSITQTRTSDRWKEAGRTVYGSAEGYLFFADQEYQRKDGTRGSGYVITKAYDISQTRGPRLIPPAKHLPEDIQKLEELNKLRDYNEQFWQNTKRSLEEGVGFITQGSRTLNTQLTALDKQFYARLSTTLAELDACIQAMIRKN